MCQHPPLVATEVVQSGHPNGRGYLGWLRMQAQPTVQPCKQLKIPRRLKFSSIWLPSRWSLVTVRVAVIVMPASQRKGTLKEISVQRGELRCRWAVKVEVTGKASLRERSREARGYTPGSHLAFQLCSAIKKLWFWTVAKTSYLGFLLGRKQYHCIHHFLNLSRTTYAKQDACDDGYVYIHLYNIGYWSDEIAMFSKKKKNGNFHGVMRRLH